MTGRSCVVLVDKPTGPTSFDMVRVARRGIAERVGHAGTLDPFASGLLLILVGQATRLSGLLMKLPKEYLVTVQFGAVSTTGDPTGVVTVTGRETDASSVGGILADFVGTLTQKVPLTSAVKVDGRPLYERAHRGEMVDTPERDVIVYDLSLLDFDPGSQTASLSATTGSGTYVRTLAEDIGRALGVGAFAKTLRRTLIGEFGVEDALLPSHLAPRVYDRAGRGVLGLDDALAFLPAFRVGSREARLAANGGQLKIGASGRFRVHGPHGLVAIYEGTGDSAKPVVVMGQDR